ncbi:SDR family NAD(P)-dependent oxidoreductase [Leptospira sp. WS92.C1]
MKEKKVVIITGAAGGIGKETSRVFAKNGYSLCLLDRPSESSKLNELKSELPGEHLAVLCDITDYKNVESSIKKCYSHFGRIDALINNAGIMRPGSFEDASLENIHQQIQVNLNGTIYCTKVALPYLKDSKGKLVIVASLAGVVPAPYHAVYVATKFGLRGLALTLHIELKKSGISVSCILPGTIESPMTQEMANQDRSSPMAYINPPLPASKVATAIYRSIHSNQTEIYVPYSQGLLSRLALSFPGMIPKIYPMMEKKGIRNQEAWKKKGVFSR